MMADLSDPANFMGQTFDCSCGQSHTIDTKVCVYEDGALDRLGNILAEHTSGRTVTLLADTRTFGVAGERARDVLAGAGWTVNTVIVPDEPHDSPVCDDITYEKLMGELGPTDIFLAVGAGVINDLTKWISFDCERPYVVVPTAASMNGYTASNVAPALKGVKAITFAHVPVAVVTEPGIIAGAPFELTASGLGDVIAKPISMADWLMNHLLLGESFCQPTSEMISTIEPNYFDHPDRVRERDEGAIKALYEALLYSGFAMTMVGTSAPASGGEHMLSHTLDIMAPARGIPHDLHGRQVGLGTIFAAALYEKLFEIDKPKLTDLPGEIDAPFWRHLAGPVAEQYEAKKPLLAKMREKLALPSVWQELRTTLKPQIRTPEQIKNCLRQAGAAHCIADISCPRDRLREAVGHMHEIRKRPTVVDLAWLLGVLPGQGDELMEQWLVQ